MSMDNVAKPSGYNTSFSDQNKPAADVSAATPPNYNETWKEWNGESDNRGNEVATPEGYNTSFSEFNAPRANHNPPSIGLDAKLPAGDTEGLGGSPNSLADKAKFNANMNGDGVMAFKSSSSNPQDMALPHGHSYGDFTQADDSMPRSRFQDKVDTRSIIKGDKGTAEST